MARPTPLHEARTNLHQITRLADALGLEAITRGTTTSEAADLLGATADPDAWHQRIAHGWTPGPDNADHHHPRWVIGSWDHTIRHHYGHQPRSTPPTLATMAAYIDTNLTDLAATSTFPFRRMRDALDACRRHLEQVLHDGEQSEYGAPCMTCRQPIQLITTDPDNPQYQCTGCGRRLNANEYRLAVQAAYLEHADRLTVIDLADRVGVNASTIRSWASVIRIQAPGQQPRELSPLLRSCGRDAKGRKVYRVADAIRIQREGGDRRRSGATVSNEGAA